MNDAGIVDEDVEAPMVGHREFDETLGETLLHHVTSDEATADLLAERLAGRFIASGQYELGALRRELPRDGVTDARGGAGHQRTLPSSRLFMIFQCLDGCWRIVEQSFRARESRKQTASLCSSRVAGCVNDMIN